ncbi:hypothetical protein D9757_006400 [Collybiopsis confluens]|uniref:Uncharacterized protein n=1 Tax=Collybiopsis confluens TaxID=2823264 RepID=A0A8H5HJN1_9AGAR|nr:hypothetical protein D9757_006400 [Collybiopsis confluens]
MQRKRHTSWQRRPRWHFYVKSAKRLSERTRRRMRRATSFVHYVLEAKVPQAVVGVEGEDARVDARMLKDDRVTAKKNHSIFTMDLDEEAALLDFFKSYISPPNIRVNQEIIRTIRNLDQHRFSTPSPTERFFYSLIPNVAPRAMKHLKPGGPERTSSDTHAFLYPLSMEVRMA